MSDVLTVDEVADRLRISKRQVQRLIKDKRLGHVRIGQRLRVVPETEVSEFIAREMVRARELGGER